jgi:hypothetical protein
MTTKATEATDCTLIETTVMVRYDARRCYEVPGYAYPDSPMVITPQSTIPYGSDVPEFSERYYTITHVASGRGVTKLLQWPEALWFYSQIQDFPWELVTADSKDDKNWIGDPWARRVEELIHTARGRAHRRIAYGEDCTEDEE